MRRYEKVRRASNRKGETNDCSVRAVSITARVPYNIAHKALADAGRASGGGASVLMILRALGNCGVHFETMMKVRQPNGSRYTAKTIGRRFPRGYYLILFNGHIAALVNGQIEDWTVGRKHQVKDVWKVTVPRGSRS